MTLSSLSNKKIVHVWLMQSDFPVPDLLGFRVGSWKGHVFTTELLQLRMLCSHRPSRLNGDVIDFRLVT